MAANQPGTLDWPMARDRAAPAGAAGTRAELLARVVGGDPAAWNEIMRQYGRLVTHTARKAGLNHSDAADAAQLTWVRLWQHGHQVREPDRLAPWLVCTARREAIRVATAAGRHVLSADPEAHSRRGQAGVHDVYPVEQEYDQAVTHALGRLPGRYRTLLLLLSSELGLSYAEVAARMGVPVGSIGPMRMRAIRMIQQTPEFTSGSIPRPAPAPDSS